jgi:hypothetical protein
MTTQKVCSCNETRNFQRHSGQSIPVNSRLINPLGTIAILLLLAGIGVSRASAAAVAGVDVLFWFDTEDLLLPADDDAAKRLAQIFTDRGIHATFKVVGEKARLLERRGRKDVIDALRKHSIGYHAEWHSVHPTPTEYLADCGWKDGIAEFIRREGTGATDVRRIFQVETLSCYGQPGASWAAQAVAALGQIGVKPHGIPCYVDEGQHVGLNHRPFWYVGVLNVFNMGRGQAYTRMELHDEAALAPAKQEVSAMAERLRSEGGGLISIFYHPCEWVHREFWDGVNFSRGANPPRSQWRLPAQRSAEETEAAFHRFEEYLDHIRSLPGVSFVTADQLPELYPDDLRQRGATPEEIAPLARLIVTNPSEVNFVTNENISYSPADQFELCVRTLASAMDAMDEKQGRGPIKVTPLLGPDVLPPATEPTELTWPEFETAVLDTRDFIRFHGQVPSRVFAGSAKIAPADFLIAMATVLADGENTARKAGVVKIPHGTVLATERFVAKDTPRLFGGWVIHRENFQAAKVLEMGRLQAWTLKPAHHISTQPK